MKKCNKSEETGATNGKMKCEDIQAVLFDYMTRELGPARSDLVREHLRKCERCQAAVVEVQTTLDLLRSASKAETGVPDRLSKERRERIMWALTHPIMDWIHRHHILVSIVVTIAVISAIIGVLRRIEIWKTDKPEGIPVIIGQPVEQKSACPSRRSESAREISLPEPTLGVGQGDQRSKQ